MENLKKVGRIGGKALLYFEIVSTLALFTGMLVGNVTHPGSGFNINPATLDAKSVADYAGAAKQQSVTEFLMNIIPTTMVDAFAKGNILQVLLVATLFGFALSIVGEKSRPVVELFDALTHAVFGVINIVMKLAPIGAFGAMAFTIGKYGIASLGPLARLIAIFYFTCIFFVLVVFGGIAWMAGFNIVKFLTYIKEEIVVVLATSSSDPALPTLMAKMEQAWLLEIVSRTRSSHGIHVQHRRQQHVHDDGRAVRRTGYEHSSYDRATTHYFCCRCADFQRRERSYGAAFIALVATLMVIPTIPVAGMALLIGIDRFMSMARACVNMIGNGVATLVVARWENELDKVTLQKNLASRRIAVGAQHAVPLQTLFY